MQSDMSLSNDTFIATISNQDAILRDLTFQIKVIPLIRRQEAFSVTENKMQLTQKHLDASHLAGNKSNLIHFDPIWSILIHFDPFWSILIYSDQIWSILIHFDPFWSILIHFAGLTNSNPVYFLTETPDHGKIMRIVRTSSVSVSGMDKRSVRDREVWQFTHEDVKNGVIYFVIADAKVIN